MKFGRVSLLALLALQFSLPAPAANPSHYLVTTSSNGAGALAEAADSPIADPNSFGLLSIATFPPRSF